MSEATKKIQALLEDGFDVGARFDRGTYTVRLMRNLHSAAAQIDVMELRAASGGADALLAEFFNGLQRDHDEWVEEASDGG